MSTLITRPGGAVLLVAVGIAIILALGLGTRAGVTGQEPRVSAGALQEQRVVPFLYPPFPGIAVPLSIFDHDLPMNEGDRTHNGWMVTFNGYKAPCADDGTACLVVRDSGENIYVKYDDHEGTDFLLRYRPVLAAATSTQVVKAGWYRSNHTLGYGLMVTLRHRSHGRVYDTLYGHLSAIAVHECDQAQDEGILCPTIKQGDVIGISGNTGFSSSPHLHFSVLDPNNGWKNWWEEYIDPYGFHPADGADVQVDPWDKWEDPDTLWAKVPVLTFDATHKTTLLPMGDLPALQYPLRPEDYDESRRVIVDDDGNPEIPLSFDFEQIPVGCWDRSGRKPEDTKGGAIHDYNVSVLQEGGSLDGNGKQGECKARWHLPVGWASGLYNVYVHIPRSADTFTDSAPYAVYSAGQPLGQVLIDQEEIRTGVQNAGGSSDDATVTAGWIFIGKYRFFRELDNYVELSNKTDEKVKNALVAADAVQFVLVNKFATAPTPTPQPTPTPRPIGITVIAEVRSGSDDAGPDPGLDCAYSPGSNETYFGRCFNGTRITSGFRFPNVAIPRNASIRNAYIDFTVDGPYHNAINLLIYGEATSNPPPFGDASRPGTRRLTSVGVPWQIRATDDWELSEERRTPDLSAIIRVIVSRPDWSPGKAMAIIFKDNGTPSKTHRRVVAFERPQSTYDGHLARLTVRYVPSTKR